MKKKNILKRIESLEVENTKLRNKYEHLLYIDDRSTILIIRHLYEQDKNIEKLLFKGLSSGMVDLNVDKYCKPNNLDESKEVIKRMKDYYGI